MIDPLYSLSGFAVGLLVGMTGVGGGALMTPILIMLFGVHPATAVGTDLLYAAATKTGGSLVHGFARSIDWRVVGRLATGSIPATILTLAALSHRRRSARLRGAHRSAARAAAARCCTVRRHPRIRRRPRRARARHRGLARRARRRRHAVDLVPKKTSKRFRDLTEDSIREIALPRGLVDVKVCAIDADWSGLKLMRRRTKRV